MHFHAHGLGAGMGVTQAGRRDVDAVYFRVRKDLLPGERVVADRAARIEYPQRLAATESVLVEIRHRPADVVQVLAHGAEREHIQTLVVNGPGRKVLAAVLPVIATRHQVNVNGFHVAWNLKTGIELKGAAGLRCARQVLAPRVQLIALAFQAVHDNVPDHLLRGATGR